MGKKYFVGVDMGTDSVGWAVTSEDYQLMAFNKKSMWGSRLFDEANTATERRMFRSSRRRMDRKKWRINILQDLFREEINKIDENFFLRLKDSALWSDDKNGKLCDSNNLFSDLEYTDVTYHMEFPTVYHLRKALIENEKQYDIRLIYLALHNIFKHRGHFLFEGKNIKNIMTFQSIYDELNIYLNDSMGVEFVCESVEKFEQVIKNKKLSKTRKKEALSKLCMLTKEDSQMKAILGLISGTTEKLNIIFDDEQLKELEKQAISFTASSYDEDRELLDGNLQERCYLLDKLKAIYDWSILAEILDGGDWNGKQYLSVSKVNVYEKHKKDLAILKRVIQKQCPNKYNSIFKESNDKVANYSAYVGINIKGNKKEYVKRCSRDNFYKFMSVILSKLDVNEDVKYLKTEIDSGLLLPLQITGDNGVIPFQVHEMELVEILHNVSSYLPFLLKKDQNGLTVIDKLIKTFEFRIPYYVGPLNAAHQEQGANCWINRKESGKIMPWNFEDKVDTDSSAEAFISRMTNKCTYLIDKDVLPKNSLLYSEFMVLNELNNVKIRDEKLPVELKKKIIDHLFKNYKRVTGKKLLHFLQMEGYEVKEDELSGFDKDFHSSLGLYHDFKKIILSNIEQDRLKLMIEQIIFWITIYSDGGKILKRKITSNYSDKLSEEEINKICKIKCSGWGNFSREFLEEIIGTDIETGECQSLIQALRNTNENLMQLLSKKYTYLEQINEENAKNQKDCSEISYKNLVEDLYVSPSVKRSIWQTIQLVEEIKKCMKADPEKIFIEMARQPDERKERTVSRKNQLLELYKNIKDEKDWYSIIEGIEENQFRSQDVFLYFTQMGRDMYTGNMIDLDDILKSSHFYDRDHIYPQSKTKDDSILNNLVLINKNDNKRKGDGLVPLDIQQNMESFWRMLRSRKLITEEKYKRLTRKTLLTDDELAGFISRQIVETRQSTKATATVLSNIYPNTEIVYVKAKAVSDFKRDYTDVVKVREINDYHHAKDAYLNIVVGNVYHTKFTSNPAKWRSENKDSIYSLNRMFDVDLIKNDKVIWKRGKEGTIRLVKETVERNDILFTRYAYCNKGALFNQQIVKAGKGKIPVKADKFSDLQRYGGYTSVKPAYFMLVESFSMGKTIRTIETVPLYLAANFEANCDFAKEYCKDQLGLEEPRILIPKIKKNAKLILNGFPMHLTGHNGKQIGMQVAAQLVLEKEDERYLKKISKYLKKNKARKDKKINISISQYDGITREDNIRIYNMLLEKHQYTIYSKRPANCTKVLEDGKIKFLECTIEEECIVLGEILHLFQCKPLKADLTLIGGTSNAGSVKSNKVISNYKSAKLVYQSVTGLYQQEINLLKI